MVIGAIGAYVGLRYVHNFETVLVTVFISLSLVGAILWLTSIISIMGVKIHNVRLIYLVGQNKFTGQRQFLPRPR